MRNIVLITLDAVRADHCSFMGYERETTPNLDKMAKKGIYFENAVAPSSKTIASMPQILTGKLMHFLDTDPYKGERKNVKRHLILNETLAEKISKKGYTTGAFCTNPYTSRYFGFDKGFDYFQDFLFSNISHQKIFKKMVEGSKIFFYLRNIRNMILRQEAFKSWESYYKDVTDWVSKAKQPFFLWVFLLDTHFPWLVPRKFRKWGNSFDMLYANWKIFRLLKKENVTTSEKVRKKLINAYDNSIYYADQFLGKLRKDLHNYNSIFIIHSDHGEELGKRGVYGHYYPHFYEQNIHVPLVISNLDESEKRKMQDPISLLNLPNIISGLANNSNPFDCFLNGRDDWIVMKDFDYDNKKDVMAIRIKDWKLITEQSDTDELYNLKQDPQEHENLIGKHPKLAEEMRKIVNGYIKQGEEMRINHRNFLKIEQGT